MKLGKFLLLGLSVLGLSACSSTGPIIYPNAHYQSVGKVVAEQDIEICRQMAESAGATERGVPGGDIVEHTVYGAGAGAASGAVGGALYGATGRGTLIGAVSGAALGLFRGIFQVSRPSQPNQAYANFVHRCLQDKGYEVTGWQ